MSFYEKAMSLEAYIKEVLEIDVDLHADGQFYRYPAPGKSPSNKACWVKVSENGRSAYFGNHITGASHCWFAEGSTNELHFTSEQSKKQHKLALKNHEEAQNDAAKTAISKLAVASPAKPGSHYVSRKQIPPDGLKQEGLNLLIPIQDIDGDIRNIQTIYPDSSKYFLKGGEIKGNFALCGELFSTPKLFICEGYATAATIHEITGESTVAAMNTGNLLAVAQEIAAHAPTGVDIIIAADNDHRTAGNPGITKGTAAAETIGAKIVYPEVPCHYPLCKCTDFNDWEHCYNRTEEI